MAMRCYQKMNKFRSARITYETVQVNPQTGICEVVEVDQCEKLPDAKNTDLALQLKAGVPLEQKNCNLLNPTGTIKLGSGETNDETNDETKQAEV